MIVVVVPLRVPLKIESPIGLGVGVIVLLPITILGTAAEGKTVVDGALVLDPGEAEMIGIDCWNGALVMSTLYVAINTRYWSNGFDRPRTANHQRMKACTLIPTSGTIARR